MRLWNRRPMRVLAHLHVHKKSRMILIAGETHGTES